MTVILQPPPQVWYCPNCDRREVTPGTLPAPGVYEARMHHCVGLRGLLAPMIPEGVHAKVEAREREDYVGREIPTCDEEGRPIMSVVTTRDEGTDAIVFPACATASREDYQ